MFFMKKKEIENPKTSPAGINACLIINIISLFVCAFPFLFRALHFNDQNSFLRKILTKFLIRHLAFALKKEAGIRVLSFS